MEKLNEIKTNGIKKIEDAISFAERVTNYW